MPTYTSDPLGLVPSEIRTVRFSLNELVPAPWGGPGFVPLKCEVEATATFDYSHGYCYEYKIVPETIETLNKILSRCIEDRQPAHEWTDEAIIEALDEHMADRWWSTDHLRAERRDLHMLTLRVVGRR